jgi:hypothetical protein
MINLKDHLKSISHKFGYEIYLDDSVEGERKNSVIRFRIESSQETFYLRISRTWKTTRIEFVPEKFASKVVDFLSHEIVAHKYELKNLLSSSDSKLSDYGLEIDKKNFTQIDALDENSHTMLMFVESMSPESSIEHGLINEIEAHLLEVAASIIVVLLPRPTNSYSNPCSRAK